MFVPAGAGQPRASLGHSSMLLPKGLGCRDPCKSGLPGGEIGLDFCPTSCLLSVLSSFMI